MYLMYRFDVTPAKSAFIFSLYIFLKKTFLFVRGLLKMKSVKCGMTGHGYNFRSQEAEAKGIATSSRLPFAAEYS